MAQIQVSDRLNNVKEKKIGFSWRYLIFGPFYLLFRLRIFSFLILICLYYYFTPLPGMEYIVKTINYIPLPAEIINLATKLLMLFRRKYYFVFGTAFIVILHLFFTFYVEGFMLKRILKRKELLPVTEADARMLIKYHVVNQNVKLAASFSIRNMNSYQIAEKSWYQQNQDRLKKPKLDKGTHFINTISPTPNRLSDTEIKKVQSIQVQLEHLQNLFNTGMLTAEEYEKRKTALIVEKYKK